MTPQTEKTELNKTKDLGKETQRRSLLETLTGSKLWKDAAFMLALLTCLAYFATYAFREGYMGYYQLGEIASVEITPSDIASAISMGAVPIFILAITYIIFTFVLTISGTFFDFLISPISLSISIILSFSYFHKESINMDLIVEVVLIVIILFTLRVLSQFKWFKSIPFVSWFIDDLINDIKKLISNWDRAVYLKWTILSIILLLIFYYFYEVGFSVAERKDSYLIVRQDNLSYAVLGERKDNLIIAPVDLMKKTVTPKYLIIDAKSTVENPINFERIHIKGGLKVKE
ncbi:hypothetical protein [Peribacillus sp. NPDC097895]|uniref:hypothetical protein n=1 Tax=Peribacillus sp. NPDC097895 TaxID=3390619 RepID=UPI003D0953DA